MLTIELSEGRSVHVRNGTGSKVMAHAGLLWITEQDSRADVVLLPGQTHVLARPGLAVVQAFSDASLSIALRGRASKGMRDAHALAVQIPFEPERGWAQSSRSTHEPLEWADRMSFGRIRQGIQAVLRTLWGAWTASRTRAQLSALNDHTLRDIGIDRAQIDSLFR